MIIEAPWSRRPREGTTLTRNATLLNIWGILFAKSCYTPTFHARGRLLPIEMVGLPVTHVVDAVGAVLRALSRYASRIARHANAARPRPPPDLSSGCRR